MAKEKTKAKPAKEAPKAKAAAKDEGETFKYGVSDLAEMLGTKPASVRVQLRNKKVKKAGKSYGWNTKAELQEVADKIKAAGADEKPAKKGKTETKPSKATSKPAKGKKAKPEPEDDDEDEDDDD